MPLSEIALLKPPKGIQIPTWLTPLSLAAVLVASQMYEPSLFHFLAGIFNTAVLILVAVVGWQAYNFSHNRYLAYIAAGYFWIALLGVVHAVTYEGMAIIPLELSNFSVQVWLVSILLEAILLVSAPFASAYLERPVTFLLFGAVAIGLSLTVFSGFFPTAYVIDEGPTPFRIGVEYLAITMLLVAGVSLQVRRERLDKHMADRMTLAILLIAGAEFAISNYVHLGQWPLVLGHFLRFVAYWVIYAVIVRTTLTEPFRVLAADASTFDAIPDPTVIVDERGVIRSANRAARSCLGVHEKDFIGRSCHALLHSREIGADQCTICSALARGAPVFDIEVELKSRRQWYHVSLSPIKPGEPTAGAVQVSRDITQRKMLEIALLESEGRYRGLVENTSDLVWETGPDNRFTYVSPKVFEVLGYGPHEMLERKITDFMDPADANALNETLRPYLTRCADYKGVENNVRHKQGHTLIMETSGGPYVDRDGNYGGYRGISRDITLRKETERALVRSEHTYRTLVENLPQYVFLKDTDARLISCNRNFAGLFGATPEQLVGKSGHELHQGQLAEKFGTEDEEIIANGKLVEFIDTLRLGGKEMTVQKIKSPVIDSEGTIVGILGIFWDITEKRRAEEALRESQMRYKAILENASDAILIANSDGRFIDANPRAEALLGYTREEILRLTMQDIHVKEDERVLKEALRQMNEYGASLVEHKVLRKDGRIVDAEVSGTRIELDEAIVYLGNFRDIGERKRVEAELSSYREHLEYLVEERTRELRVSNAELEAFSYSVSHDLRSPLRAINGYGEALREELAEYLSSESSYFLDRMRAATNRMGELIDGLLNLSQVIRREFKLSEVNLSEIAAGIAASLLENNTGRTVRFQIDRGLMAFGDHTLLRVLLENLFNNAWKFTAKREDACIEFGREVRPEAEVFFVRDNGAGFDMQFAHKLFQPFERLHPHGEFEGTGIGLATVRRIVERHGGSVWAEGSLGEGTSIYFSLAAKE